MSDAPEDLATWCEVDLAALEHNARALRSLVSPGARLAIVVKSDAYGHGLEVCGRTFAAAGADGLVVNTPGEAQRLRAAGVSGPLYLCGPVRPAQAGLVVATGARPVVYDRAAAAALGAAAVAAGRTVGVHLKVETGTQRQGVAGDEVVAFARWLVALPGVELEGLCTHFADVEDGENHRFARAQLAALEEARQGLRAAGIKVALCHAASSAAALLIPESRLDLVRVGIAAYGLWPSGGVERLAAARGVDAQLQPALSWHARVAQVRQVPAGASVGYGRTCYLGGPGRQLAVLPVGYYEGLGRRRSNSGHVLVRGQTAPVRGRVCMNMAMVEVTGIPGVGAGDTATLIGRDGAAAIDAAQAATWAGTIPYEAVACIHPSVPRLYRRSDRSLSAG